MQPGQRQHSANDAAAVRTSGSRSVNRRQQTGIPRSSTCAAALDAAVPLATSGAWPPPVQSGIRTPGAVSSRFRGPVTMAGEPRRSCAPRLAWGICRFSAAYDFSQAYIRRRPPAVASCPKPAGRVYHLSACCLDVSFMLTNMIPADRAGMSDVHCGPPLPRPPPPLWQAPAGRTAGPPAAPS